MKCCRNCIYWMFSDELGVYICQQDDKFSEWTDEFDTCEKFAEE